LIRIILAKGVKRAESYFDLFYTRGAYIAFKVSLSGSIGFALV